MYMDNIKSFAQNEKELEILRKIIRIQPGYRNGIWHKKCAILIMKSWKREITEGLELHNKERIRTLGEKKNCNYFRILKADTIKQVEMKEKITKEYLR